MAVEKSFAAAARLPICSRARPRSRSRYALFNGSDTPAASICVVIASASCARPSRNAAATMASDGTSSASAGANSTSTATLPAMRDPKRKPRLRPISIRYDDISDTTPQSAECLRRAESWGQIRNPVPLWQCLHKSRAHRPPGPWHLRFLPSCPSPARSAE